MRIPPLLQELCDYWELNDSQRKHLWCALYDACWLYPAVWKHRMATLEFDRVPLTTILTLPPCAPRVLLVLLQELVKEQRITHQAVRLIASHIFAKIDAQGHWRGHEKEHPYGRRQHCTRAPDDRS
jgi:hypothetical protein